MRRVLAVVLTGLGTFFLAMALLVRFFALDQVIKFPLNEVKTYTLAGTGMSYLSPSTGLEVTGASLRTVVNIRGDGPSGSSSRAVWEDVNAVYDDHVSARAPFSVTTARVAFDRRTGQLLNCCRAKVGSASVPMSGLAFVWPFGAQRKTYDVFDVRLLKPVPARYLGQATVDGVGTFIYRYTISGQKIGTITLPGSLAGMATKAMVTLPEYLTAANTYYVDPVSGTPVRIVESQQESLRDPATGATAVSLFSGTQNATPASVASVARQVSSGDSEISALRFTGPLAGLLLGLVLLAAGLRLAAARLADRPAREEAAAVQAHSPA